MMQTANGNVRKTIEMDIPTEGEIQRMADEKLWSFSQMAFVLLQQAIKERNRKKKKETI